MAGLSSWFCFTLARHLFMTELSLAKSQAISIGFNSKFPLTPTRPLRPLTASARVRQKCHWGYLWCVSLAYVTLLGFCYVLIPGIWPRWCWLSPCLHYMKYCRLCVFVCLCGFAIFWMAVHINNGNCNFSCMHIARSTTILLALWKSA